MVRQPVAQHARDDVVGATGREAHHELHRAVWIFLLRARRNDQNEDEAKQGDAESNDAHGTLPFRFECWPWRIWFRSPVSEFPFLFLLFSRRGAYAPTPLSFNASPISSSALESSIVAGMVQLSPSAIFFIVPRRILPERVLGRRATVIASLNAATGPIRSRTSETISRSISSVARVTPALSTMKPQGTSPLSASAMPITAHSATSECAASTSSIPPVERRWPATLMMSSVRPMMNR